jgi:CRP-like cAMP-binding protein
MEWPTLLRAVLRAGDSFGEYALLTKEAVRSATLISKGKTHLAVLSKADYEESIGLFCE